MIQFLSWLPLLQKTFLQMNSLLILHSTPLSQSILASGSSTSTLILWRILDLGWVTWVTTLGISSIVISPNWTLRASHINPYILVGSLGLILLLSLYRAVPSRVPPVILKFMGNFGNVPTSFNLLGHSLTSIQFQTLNSLALISDLPEVLPF